MADITINRGMGVSHQGHPLESDQGTMHPLISWRSIVAGSLVTFFCFAVLLSLGMAFGGITLDQGGTSAQNVGIFSGVWFLVSSILSLFAGSYFAARISKFHTNRIGSAQGLVIASLFFGFFLWQTMSAIGWVGNTAGSLVSGAANAVGAGASQAARSPAISNTINQVVQNALQDLNLQQDPKTVFTGVATRLAQGDTEGAKNYLAAQAGIPPEEADRRINELQAQIGQTATQAREGAATALQGVGWSLFATLLLGGLASVSGGALGSHANYRKPLSREQQVAIEEYHAAPV